MSLLKGFYNESGTHEGEDLITNTGKSYSKYPNATLYVKDVVTMVLKIHLFLSTNIDQLVKRNYLGAARLFKKKNIYLK